MIIYMERTLISLLKSGVSETDVNNLILGCEAKKSKSGESYFIIKGEA